MFYFVSGYTSKVAGTERGITDPVSTFSTCFGAPFMPLPSSVYAKLLGEKIEKHGSSVYLINVRTSPQSRCPHAPSSMAEVVCH